MVRAALWACLSSLVLLGASWLLLGRWWATAPTAPKAPPAEGGEPAGPGLATAGVKPQEPVAGLGAAWLLAELESNDAYRARAAYRAAMQHARIPWEEALAKRLIGWLGDPERPQGVSPVNLLTRMGPEVLPLLDPVFASEGAPARREAFRVLLLLEGRGHAVEYPDWRTLLEDEDAEVRRLAYVRLRGGVPYDEALAGYLLERSFPLDGVARTSPEAVLARMGPQGIAHLLAILDDPRSKMRVNALRALKLAHPDHLRPHLARLAQLITADDEDESVAAIQALGAMQGDCEVCLPALTEALGNESILVQEAAVDAILYMGERGGAAVPALIALLGGGDERLIVRVARVFERTQLAPERAMPALAEAMRSDAGEHAALALATYGPGALPHALKVFRDGDDAARHAALLALGRLGAAAREIVPALPALVRSDDHDLARRAVDVAGRIGPDAAPVVPAVLERLWTGDLISPGQAADALMKIGDAAKEPLRAALAGGDADRRRTTVEVLTACWGWSGFALDELAGLMEADDPDLRHLAAKAILVSVWEPHSYGHHWSQVDPDSEPALRARVRAIMVEASGDSSQRVSTLAAETVRAIDRVGNPGAR